MHITHGLDVVLLALVELFLQLFELCAQHFNLDVKVGDVMFDCVYGTSFALYLRIDDHQVLQPSLDVPLIVAQSSLLLLDSFLYLLSLVLQCLHRGLFSRFLASLAFGSHRSFLYRRLLGTFLLCMGSQGEGQ